MNAILKQVNGLKEIIEGQGVISITIYGYGYPHVLMKRDAFLKAKKEYGWETNTEIWSSGRVAENITLDNIKIESILDKSEVTISYTYKEAAV